MEVQNLMKHFKKLIKPWLLYLIHQRKEFTIKLGQLLLTKVGKIREEVVDKIKEALTVISYHLKTYLIISSLARICLVAEEEVITEDSNSNIIIIIANNNTEVMMMQILEAKQLDNWDLFYSSYSYR
jgi:hypothetical protein